MSSYTAYARGEKITGEIPTRSATNITISGNQTYYAGYYPSNWTVSGLDTSDATAAAKNIETGYTAYVNGLKIVGSAIIPHELINLYPGSINLQTARLSLAVTNVGNYVLFAGGSDGNNYSDAVDALDSSLTMHIITPLSQSRYFLAASTTGNYAIIAGGQSNKSPQYSNIVDAYNTSLVRSTPTALSQGRDYLTGAHIGNYALFCGGRYHNSDLARTVATSVVDVYNSSLSRSAGASISANAYYTVSTNIGNYALVCGGETPPYSTGYNTSQKQVNAYNTSLTKSNPTELSQARVAAATSIENYALIGGGRNLNTYYTTVDAYNTSLSRSNPAGLSIARHTLGAMNTPNYAIFIGGMSGSSSATDQIDIYDKNLTLNSTFLAPKPLYQSVGSHINNFAILAAGYIYNGSANVKTSTVYAYYES